MSFQKRSFSAEPLPDLEEFFSALGGVLDKDAPKSDITHIKFLSLFCRSIGAREGHLLRTTPSGELNSLVSFGLGKSFDGEFNKAGLSSVGAPSPLHMAYSNKEVIAVIDVEKDNEMPSWFMDLMNRHQFKSLVAVPLMGSRGPLGVLCAYYHDVCLFDQGTLNHLTTIGRMLGTTIEKEAGPSQKAEGGKPSLFPDELLRQLTIQVFTKPQVYEWAVKNMAQVLGTAGMMMGSVRKGPEGLTLTVLAGVGIPSEAHSRRYLLPSFVGKDLFGKARNKNRQIIKIEDWQDLGPFVREPISCGIGVPLLWGNKMIGGIVLWRSSHSPFNQEEEFFLQRIAGLTAMALHT